MDWIIGSHGLGVSISGVYSLGLKDEPLEALESPKKLPMEKDVLGRVTSDGMGYGPGMTGHDVFAEKYSGISKPGRPRATHQARETRK